MNKKGFTLIELLTVIAILGILVLLAAPKFLGYTEKANIAKIQTGIKAVETAVDLKSLEDPEFTKDWVVITPDKLQEINDSGKLIDKNGLIKEDLDGGKNVPLKDLDNVKWNSGGEFIVNEEDDSVYYYNKDINVSKNPDGSANIPGDNNGDGNGEGSDNGDGEGSGNGGTPPEETTPPVEEPKEPEITYPIIHGNGDKEDKDGNITKPDGNIIKPDGSVVTPNGTFPVATNGDFTWQIGKDWDLQDNLYTVSGQTGKGYYKYTGSASTVVLPKTINGHNVVSYYRMFDGSNVKKVVSYNNEVTDMAFMFISYAGSDLDLTALDTSNVINMQGLFQEAASYSSPYTVDVSTFNTSKVTNMSHMFYYSNVSSLDLSSFETSNVTNFSNMFNNSKNLTVLDLRNFNTSNAITMEFMFPGTNITELNLTSFNTSKVKNMIGMFRTYQGSTLDLSSFDMSGVTQLEAMLNGAQATIGYAKSSSDAAKLNSSITEKPSTLTFRTK